MIVSTKTLFNDDSDGACRQSLRSRPALECIDGTSRTLTIGLMNNMPDAALEATERQFASLLDATSGDISIRLLFFALPGVPRGISVIDHIRNSYLDLDEMMSTPLDALIVTGREPMSPCLQEEPYWDSFTRVVEWARENTISTVWSCLAAHAAVLYMDGIERVRSQRKHCGVFDCARVGDHHLTGAAGPHFRMPHSRWNGLDERELLRRGYRVLTHSALAGVDTFVRDNNSLFVFFQGHPEYEANTLLLEYRRDVSRYLRGENPSYPNLPYNYFDAETTSTLNELAREARLFPREELLARVTTVLDEASMEPMWQRTAISLYKRWLEYLCTQKFARMHAGKHQNEAESETPRLIPPSPALDGEYQRSRTALTASRRISTVL